MTTQRKKPHFSLSYIRSPLHAHSQWTSEPLSDVQKRELKKIVSQDFNYLGSGAEMFAFVSADGHYVMKFFRMKHLIPKKWLHFVPLPGLEDYRLSKTAKRIARQQQLFTNYKRAYDDLKNETGLVYIHLNKTKDLKLSATLYDRLRKRYKISLDDYEFVIQKRGQLVYDRLTYLMQQGKREKAVMAIHALLSHVEKQCKKGYIDQDSGVSQNYGFIGDEVIHFDVGRITYDEIVQEPTYRQHEIIRVGEKLAQWLEDHYPILLPSLEEAIEARI